MKINEKIYKNDAICDLSPGEVFIANDPMDPAHNGYFLFVSMDDGNFRFDSSIEKDVFAVNLRTGKMVLFDTSEKVSLCDDAALSFE